MANEITVQTSLMINKKSDDRLRQLVQFQSQPLFFRADMAGSSGPYVGTVIVQQTYTVIDLSRVATPGMCHLHNQSAANFVEVGIWSPAAGDFFPLLELLPGEVQVVRLSRYIGQGLMPGTGTGTSDTDTNYFAMKATGGVCKVLLNVFPR